MPIESAPLPALALALTLALLTGCAAPPAPVPAVVVPPEPAPMPVAPEPPQADEAPAIQPLPLKDMLAYADRTYRMPAPELAAEVARLTPLAEDSPRHQLELALALGQTRQPPDTARALALVQRVLGQPASPSAYRSFARLLENRFLHQRRLEEQADRQAQQLKDLQRKNDQLGERLEAMRAIERSLNTRPNGAP